MRITPAPRPLQRKAVLDDLREGWHYVARFVPIRSVLLLLALSSLVAMPYSTLMPILAGNVLHGGPHTFGFLMGASGVGALISAGVLATRRSVLGLGKVIPASATLFGAGLIALSFSRTLWLSLLVMLVVGGGMMQQMAASNTILQTVVDDDKRGRVMSFYSMAFLGMTPFGSLLEGAAASRIGVPHTLMIGGFLCIAGAVWFSSQLPTIRAAIRPTYVRLGILPEAIAGVQSARNLLTPPED
jgi:predicted MFS family arabinose efflux permease